MRRRGSIYVFVLGASTLAAAAGLTAVILHTQRLERVRLTAQSERARADAQSAIEFAVAVLGQDPAGTTWRTSSALAYTDKRYFGDDASVVSIAISDPGDNDLSDSMYDPVTVDVSAVADPCQQDYQLTLTPSASPLSCLDFAVTVAGSVSKLGTGDIYTSGAVSAGKAWEVDSDARPDVGGTLGLVARAAAPFAEPVLVWRAFPGGTQKAAQAQTLMSSGRSGVPYDPGTMESTIPNRTDIAKYYVGIGTSISYSSLSGGAVRDCVLSAAKNPYGATNAKGVYVIDCGGSDLTVRNCRISGTLVVLNAGAGSLIRDGINLEAPSGQPALVVVGSMTFSFPASDIKESEADINLNPSGSPYDGSADSDKSDQYASWIKGPVFISGDLSIATSGHATVYGSVVVGGNLSIQSSGELRVLYHKPLENIPGFCRVTGMALQAGSLKRVVR